MPLIYMVDSEKEQKRNFPRRLFLLSALDQSRTGDLVMNDKPYYHTILVTRPTTEVRGRVYVSQMHFRLMLQACSTNLCAFG